MDPLIVLPPEFNHVVVERNVVAENYDLQHDLNLYDNCDDKSDVIYYCPCEWNGKIHPVLTETNYVIVVAKPLFYFPKADYCVLPQSLFKRFRLFYPADFCLYNTFLSNTTCGKLRYKCFQNHTLLVLAFGNKAVGCSEYNKLLLVDYEVLNGYISNIFNDTDTEIMIDDTDDRPHLFNYVCQLLLGK